ncbi:unnamed protein product [Dibothriocephalus latus]|uniref:Uncharacterized protein n=1 Tax=Dibothriocephalus latus TaxID=60516 RepID=A0A3P7P7R9_DIBLA|nr:unnamed protein product [Dibothriocephalus latus]
MAFRALLSQVKPTVGSAFTALQHSSLLSRSPRASNSSIGSRMRSMGRNSVSERTRSVEEESHRHSLQDSPEMIEWEEAERRRLVAEMDQRYIKERQLKEKSMEPIKELLREVTSRLSVLSARLSRNRTNRPASAGDAT